MNTLNNSALKWKVVNSHVKESKTIILSIDYRLWINVYKGYEKKKEKIQWMNEQWIKNAFYYNTFGVFHTF